MFEKRKLILNLKLFILLVHKAHFIIILVLLLINIFERKYEITHVAKNKKFISSNKIIYKGKIVLKSDLINEYLSNISNDSFYYKEAEGYKFNLFYNLADYSNNLIVQYELKSKLLDKISKFKNKTITQLETLYISNNSQFGNWLITINNAIFYFEVVGCHNIILNEKQLGRKWLIIKSIYIDKFNITIMQGKNVDCKNNKVLCIYEISKYFFYFPKVIKPEIRIHLIKLEILKNLPLSLLMIKIFIFI